MTTDHATEPTIRLGEKLVSPDERARLEVMVPDPLVRAEVLNWLEATRIDQELAALLFRGAVTPCVVEGELRWETGRGEVERILLRGASPSPAAEVRR